VDTAFEVQSQSTPAYLVTLDLGTGRTATFTATGNNGFGNPGPVVVNGFTWTGNPQATYGNASCNVGNNGTRSNTGNFAWVAAGSFLLCHRALLPLHVIAGSPSESGVMQHARILLSIDEFQS
jgi:hypothetical protein